MINFDALRASNTRTNPFQYMVGENVLTKEQAADIRRDYPEIKQTGYLPLSKLEATGAFQSLIEDLQKPELAEILSDKLGLNLIDKPRMITVRRLSKHGDGRIHNDSKSKICTMLIYLNDDWDNAEGGAIRALNGDKDMDDYAEEVSPLAGNVFAFKRSETSWHGHPSFKGERYVVQTTFLISEEELARKEKRGGFQTKLKRLLRIN
ncbi:2OG-Fe(II) oxygenase [Pseudovibrio sp. JE062]|uniref:2OG-Fe(II) oxygenase n=1 Tax=Pseudovibrio sp. JE062 TaxID=439495 RepID=UPI001AD9478C|nr:2OG-Fe(II) oxygenase [Pseudovibrio sp. JE062]